jgi:hypothetical protein
VIWNNKKNVARGRMSWFLRCCLLVVVMIGAAPLAWSHGGPNAGKHLKPFSPAQAVLDTKCCVFETVGVKSGRIRYLARDVDERARRVRDALGLDGWGAPVVVRMVHDFDDLHDDETVPEVQRLGSWVGGVAFPERRIVVVRTKNRSVEDTQSTLLHELVHVYVGERGNFKELPRWFSEGVAMYFADERFQEHLRATMMAASRNQLPTMELLTDYFPNDPGSVNLAYATSHSFLTWVMVSRGGDYTIQNILDRLITGFSFERAFQREIGDSVAEMERAWLETMETGSWLPWLWSLPNMMWFFMSVLFVYGWFRYRGEKKKILQRMDEQERALDVAFHAVTYPEDDRPESDVINAAEEAPSGDGGRVDGVLVPRVDRGFMHNVDGAELGITRITPPDEIVH